MSRVSRIRSPSGSTAMTFSVHVDNDGDVVGFMEGQELDGFPCLALLHLAIGQKDKYPAALAIGALYPCNPCSLTPGLTEISTSLKQRLLQGKRSDLLCA